MSIDIIEPFTLDREVNASREPTENVAQSSASKALELLEVISKARGNSFGLTEVAADIGVPKSTAHRLLKTLVEHGFVGRSGSRYRVGGTFFELSEAARWSEFGELRDVASGPLNWLFERSNADAVHVATLSGRDVLYLDKITRPAGTGCRAESAVASQLPARHSARRSSPIARGRRCCPSSDSHCPGSPPTRLLYATSSSSS
ncbi:MULTISPECIES: helix-turn-helix domain-containing protein [Rhodococcus]|jgi:hypothetical protein|uniref:Glycerol operon regulatory protein n=1 Tax=Rhodococcus qingshengii JCM 15477 TaxID=1303681 RepID=A0AB38RMX7_RHOSG|nr:MULTISPECIES: helix-turn-helix domain-containing protein [Rhodococcus]ANQ75876.1 hypothetical protein AOT96_33490 [Rhodococcus sp. 008]KSU69306.1 hypothetical protein AS032_29100 [Rhodococcus qingshengii]MDA3635196.1 helix-turn-helix domain-containing protein [Rhodococcus sp. C-2]UPU46459.1 helix-turn-helix domain-containing protein [Rhodococcus qingshengii JCM 15477]SCC66724.1 IclR helix-turn-helix domain-containing protein [Rhodococcus qingshengii]